MAYSYDDQNIFAKIIRGEIPNYLNLLHSRSLDELAPARVSLNR